MPKNIVFCADGTWNHPDETDGGVLAPTNVYKFFNTLLQTDTQAPHYDSGVGTDGTPIDQLLGGAIGEGLFQKIKDGYTIIARSYQDGDQIYLFGFSRGAYTARSLGGMIAVCGLPAPGKFDGEATDAAFVTYRAPKMRVDRSTLLNDFVAKYSARDVQIAMVGVWDTVGALGIPGDLFNGLDTNVYGFLDTSLHPDVQAAYHALAIDEKRNEFAPTVWTTPASPAQIVEQIWFSGVHCDVGGGYAEHGLSDITLGWMMGKAAARGLVFDSKLASLYPPLDSPPMLSNPKFALDVTHESWTALWGFPATRMIGPNASFSNSVAIRWAHVPGYQPKNLPTGFPGTVGAFNIVPTVFDPA
jgi:uncharacterized protein (DUF2235 family)